MCYSQNSFLFKGKIKEANEFLVHYTSKYTSKLNALWLNDFAAALVCYKNAIRLFPDNYYLQFDSTKMLVEIGAYDEGENLLKKYLSYDPENTDSFCFLAKLNYWEDNYNDALSWKKNNYKKP
jgi:predicted Zn-dependent protease